MANIKWRNDGSGLGDIEGRDDLVMHDMVYRHPIKGAKKDKNAPRKPVIMKDSASSTSIAKIQYGLSEGTIWGLVDGGKSIILDGTPLEAADGTENFKNITYDIRLGTNDQTYMQGFPDVSNEVGIGVELKSTAPYVRAINDTQLSAIRVRLRWNGLSSTNPENGDVSGHRINYAIDLQTDGGAYVEVLNTTISDKVSTGYERTHRIDLPRATTGWQIRIRRLTANSSSEYVRDTMYVDAIAEVIDAKFNYPNTAHMGIEFDSENFRGIPKLEAHVRGMIVRIPTNYDPVTRKYVGIWDGLFKEAYTNNPAWIYYDILTAKRYGLGDRIDTNMVDKWVIYTLGVFCDQLVPDGLGGEEPRFTCNVYLQKTSDAYQVLSSLSGIFRAMAFWNGEKIILDADMPKDPVYTFSRANTVADENGICFNHTGSRLRDRHTVVKVAWDNPNNAFQTEYEYVRDEKAISKYGIRTLDLSAFGCTSQGQAQRAGLWALRTEQLETRQITFSVGLDGFLPQVADVINVADELFAGRANSGRVSNISTGRTVVTLDRDLNVKVGDVLIINGSDGKAERRVVKSVAGRKVTMVAAFTKAEKQNIWALETADLKLMRFRVMSIQENGDSTFNITALQHEPKKFPAIDSGADVIPDNITSITPDIIDAPTAVTITTRHRVVQGVTVTTLVINWGQVKTAVGYDVEWRKDDGNWIKVPRTGNTTVEVEGVYAGRYTAQVRAVSAYDVSSAATFSSVTEVKGKVGLPPAIIGLTVTGVLFGFDLKWSFGAGSGDAAFTEIQVASAPNVNVKQLGLYAYNTNKLQINGLMGNLSQSFRARLVDKLGFTSAWSAWVTGTTSASAAPIMDMIQGQINESSLNQALTSKIDKIETNSSSIGGINTELDKAKADIIAADKVIAANKLEATNAVAAANTELDKAKADIIAADKIIAANKLEATNAVTAANAEISKAKTDIIAADKAIAANKLEATNAVAAANKAIADNKLIASNAVAAANAEIAASKVVIDSNKTEIATAKTELNAAKTQLATAVADIGTAKTDITKAKTDIVAAKSVADAAKAEAAANKISLVAINKAVGENKTSVEASITELTNKDLSLSNLYTALKSEYDTNKASVSNSITTLTNKDTSLSNSLTALDTDYKGNKTAIRNELTAVSNKTNSTASSLTSLTTEVGKNKTAISTEATTRSTEDTALSNRITTVSGKTDNALSRISTAETAISTNAGAITQQKTDITAAYTKAIDDIEIGGRNLFSLNKFLEVTPTGFYKRSADKLTILKIDTNSGYPLGELEANTNYVLTTSVPMEDRLRGAYEKSLKGRNIYFTTDEMNTEVLFKFLPEGFDTSIQYPVEVYVKLEKGNKATDFTLAPEDVEADYTAAISTEATARADADKAITSSVTSLKSDYDANKASVTQSLGTLTNKDTALTNQLTALDADYKGNKTAIRNELTAVSNKANSTANSLTSLTTEVDKNKTAISTESTARSTADTALGNRITTLDTDYKGNKTAIRNELTAVSNKANSTANSLSTLTTTVGGNTTKISQESTARSTADTALGNRITATDAIAKDAQSRVGTAETAISNATSAMAQQKTDITAEYKQAINDIEIGGRNLLENTNREVYSGNYSRAEYTLWGEIQDALEKEPVGSDIVISFDVIMAKGLYLMAYCSNTMGATGFSPSKSFSNIGTDKQRLSFVTKVVKGSTTTRKTKLEFYSTYGSEDWYTISNVKIEKGNKATAWTPAPEDIDNAIAANTASISSEATARSNAIESVTGLINTLDSEYKGNKATVASSLSTLTNKDTALTNSLTALTTRVGTAESTITTNNNALVAKDKSLTDSLTALTSDFNGNKTTVSNSLTALSTADTALGNRINSLTTTVGTNTTKIGQETTARTNADTTLGNRITTVEGKTDSALSRIGTVETIAASNTSSIASTKTDVTAAFKAISDIEMGGRNLLLDSGRTINNSSYLMNTYTVSEIIPHNQEITITVWGKLSPTRKNFRTYRTDGASLVILNDLGNDIHRGTVKFNNPNNILLGLRLYQTNSTDTGDSTVYRIKLEKGNKATDWTPAPEDIEADYNAKISTEATARSNADTTLTNLITTLDTDYKGNKTAIRNELTAVSNKANSTANSLSTLTTTVGGNTTKISQESTARSTADTALGNRITATDAIAKNAQSRIGTAETAIANNTGAITQQKTDITAEYKQAIDDIEVGGRNLIISGEILKGKYILESTGAVASAGTHDATGFIEVSGNASYTLSNLTENLHQHRIIYYDNTKTRIVGKLYAGAQPKHITVMTPSNCAFVRISGDNNYSPSKNWKFEKGNKATAWTPAPEDVEADYNAKISTESTARSDADTALGSRITTLDTDYKGNKTAIRTELTAVSNKVNSTANSLSTLTTTVGGNTTKISQESTARSTADTALGNRITATDAIAKNAQSRVGTVETAVSNNTGAIATTNTNLSARFEEAKDYADLKSGVLVISSNTKKFINPASYSVDSATLTGYLVIETPITPARMVNLKLSGFNYSSSSTVGLNLSFYNYSSSFINTGYESTGRYTIDKVQLAKKDADKKAVIIIGLATSTWNYPKLVLEEVIVGYGSTPDSYLNEFSIRVTTDISAYTNITNVSGVDLQGALQENSAAISTESTARSTADTALSNRITTLDTDYQGNKTAIRSELTAVSNKANSTANSLSTLTTTVGGNTTKISQESTARSTADTALGNRITATDAIAKDAQSRVGTAETAISNATSAIATLRTDLTASYNIQDTRATNELPSYYYSNYPRQTVREFKQKSVMTGVVGSGTYIYLETVVRWSSVSGGAIVQTAVTDDNRIYIRTSASATAWREWIEQEDVTGSAAKVAALKTALGKDISAVDARVTAEKKVAADATKALASTVSALDTDYKGNKTAIRTELTAVSNKTNSTATSVGTLQTTVNGHTSSIQTQQTSINGLNAQYTVKLDVGGRVSGFGLASSSTQSDFAVNADKFYIAPPSGSAKGVSPFMVLTSPKTINGVSVPAGTYMQSAFIHNGSIDTAHIRSAAVKTAQIDNGSITTAKIGTAQVDTLQIKGEAVTVPRLIYDPNTRKAFTNTANISGRVGTYHNGAYLDSITVNGDVGEVVCLDIGKGSFDPMGGSVSIQLSLENLYFYMEPKTISKTLTDIIPEEIYIGVEVIVSGSDIPLRRIMTENLVPAGYVGYANLITKELEAIAVPNILDTGRTGVREFKARVFIFTPNKGVYKNPYGLNLQHPSKSTAGIEFRVGVTSLQITGVKR